MGMHTSTATIETTSPAISTAIEGPDSKFVTIPDAQLLFHGDFKRTGSDLTLTGEDGQRVVVPDYFKHEHLPTLLSSDGAGLTGDIVEALAGPQAPGQYAQAGVPVQINPTAIGRVATVQGDATAIRNGVAVSLNTGDIVLKGDVIITAGNSAVGVIFTDGTTFALSSNARMVLNEFVYSAGSSSNSALINLVQGSVTFIAGEVAKSGDMKVGTPVAVMGIRGTMVQVDIDVNNGQTRLAVLVEPNGVTGSFNVYSLSGQFLGTVNDAGVGAMVASTGPLEASFTSFAKSPAELQEALQIVQQVVQTQSVGQAILQQQPVETKHSAAPGTQITALSNELSTTKIEVFVTTTPNDPFIKVNDVQIIQPPPNTPAVIPFIPTAPANSLTDPKPFIHAPEDGIQYWASNTSGNVTPINRISFSDANAFALVRVTFSMDDACDALNACNLYGSGVTVVSGNGTSEIVLEGTIVDINAFLFHGNLQWNPSGSSNNESGVIKVQIDDNGSVGGGNVATAYIPITEACLPSGSAVDLSNINFTNGGAICAGAGCDTVTTSWQHGGTETTYDGGNGDDMLHLVFTPDQLAEILADCGLQDALRSYAEDPSGTLDLSGSSWNATATNFEQVDVNLATGFGTGNFSIQSFFCDLPPEQGPSYDDDLIIGTSNDDCNLGGSNGSDGKDVLVGLAGNDTLNGGGGADLLLGGSGDDILVGGTGNDVLSGSTGVDVFRFGEMCGGSADFGHDTIVDFHPGEDVIEFDSAIFGSFADLLAAATEVDGDVVIAVDANNSVTLKGVSMAAVAAHQTDFHIS